MKNLRFVWAGGISVLAWALLGIFSPGASIPWTSGMVDAAETMDAAVAYVARHCREAGIPLETGLDPNGTCLVGPEHTALFTSLGQLEAKRTATAPDMAGLLAHLLSSAGVGEGDRVAIGASGSFPGFLLATLAAVEALGAEPVTILSLGASSFGATRPAFHLLDLYRVLEAGGFVSAPAVAVSLGGSGDRGGEFDESFRQSLFQELHAGDVPVLQEPDLTRNVSNRLSLYGSVAAFVNIGGAEVNLGTSPQILTLPAGLVTGGGIGGVPDREKVGVRGQPVRIPPRGERGVLFEMVSRGVPVLHLLHVRGLALRYGLPWDPLPLPAPASLQLRDAQRGKDLRFWLITVGYVLALAVVAFQGRFSGQIVQPRDRAVTGLTT